ncbi:hypothetical protein, partial [Nocardia abscessus]|uniref:hypothetical protein n=1 Tax=Nocardia abscessus TaxID=120957 RepID=UPI002455E3B9
ANTGDGIQAGMGAGAAIGFMEDAWWGPTIFKGGKPWFALAERNLPGVGFVFALFVLGPPPRGGEQVPPAADTPRQFRILGIAELGGQFIEDSSDLVALAICQFHRTDLTFSPEISRW